MLYNFDSFGNATLIEECLEPIPQGSSEPRDYTLTGAGDIDLDMDTYWSSTVKSIRQYGGFFIGRYEASLSSDGSKTECKYTTPMNATADSGNQWVGMYEKLRSLNTSSIASQAVGTGMIWGCEWDRVMKFINGSLDGGGNEYLVGTNGRNRHVGITQTGNNNDDKVKNIYDLEGNLREFTLEAHENEERVARGGSSFYYGPAAERTPTIIADFVDADYGSRQVLYIKPDVDDAGEMGQGVLE